MHWFQTSKVIPFIMQFCRAVSRLPENQEVILQTLMFYTNLLCMQNCSQISSPHSLKPLSKKQMMLRFSERRGNLKFRALYWGNWKLESPEIHISKLGPHVGALRVVRAEGCEGNAKKPEVSMSDRCLCFFATSPPSFSLPS